MISDGAGHYGIDSRVMSEKGSNNSVRGSVAEPASI